MAAWHTNADLFHQWEEAEIRADSWRKKCAHEKALREAVELSYCRQIQEMQTVIDNLQATVKKLTEKSEEEKKALLEEIERLKSMLNNNSSNSSVPPSKDQKPCRKNANEYNGRKKSDRKRGGQPGHNGKTLTKKDVEDLIHTGKVEHIIIERNKSEQASENYISKYECDI